MLKDLLKIICVIVAIGVLFVGCRRDHRQPDVPPAPTMADLIPMKTAMNVDGGDIEGAEGYCKKNDFDLLVTIKNVGERTAQASNTTVKYILPDSNRSIDRPTPELAPGDSAEIMFDFPIQCKENGCDFHVTADSQNDVAEGTGEGNNNVLGRCRG